MHLCLNTGAPYSANVRLQVGCHGISAAADQAVPLVLNKILTLSTVYDCRTSSVHLAGQGLHVDLVGCAGVCWHRELQGQ
jgi:hypothetical protein